MIPRPYLLLAPLLLGGCGLPRQQSSADRAISLACRQQVDRAYAVQNRRDLSYRDQRDTPFANSYNAGVTSAGLGQRFGRDNDVQSCVSQNRPGASAGEPGIGPTFSPAAR